MNYPAISSESIISSLIPVFNGYIAGKPAQLCNARDLHFFLEVGRDFSTWINERFEKYGFVEGEDFCVISAPQIGGAGNRGKTKDYHLTLSTAKGLSMVENNARGRQARKYFIRCEEEFIKSLKNPVGFTITQEQLTFSINSAIKNAVEDAFAPFKNALFNTIAAPINKRLDNIVSAIQSVPAQAPAYQLPFDSYGTKKVKPKATFDEVAKKEILAALRRFGPEGTTKGVLFNQYKLRIVGYADRDRLIVELVDSGFVATETRKKGIRFSMYIYLAKYQ